VSFDFPYTCPDIDAAIGRALDSLRDSIDDLLNDACPLLSTTLREAKAKEYADSFYSNLEDSFEDVRKANAHIRKAAEQQVEKLEGEVADLRLTVRDLESRIEA
jgi:uncharacterized protein YceH (UPF0502 family)